MDLFYERGIKFDYCTLHIMIRRKEKFNRIRVS